MADGLSREPFPETSPIWNKRTLPSFFYLVQFILRKKKTVTQETKNNVQFCSNYYQVPKLQAFSTENFHGPFLSYKVNLIKYRINEF